MKLASRKFWMAIVAIVTALIAIFTGAIPVDLGVKIILGAVTAYMGAEGVVDLGHALNSKAKPKK